MIHKVINWALWSSLVFCGVYAVGSLVYALLRKVEVNSATFSFVGLVVLFASVIAGLPAGQEGVQIVLLLVEFIFVGWWFLDSESPRRNPPLKRPKGPNKARHRRSHDPKA